MLYCVCGAYGSMSETPGNWSLLRDFPGVSLRLPENSTHFTPNSVDFRRISTKTRTIPAPALAPRRNCVLPVAEGAPVRAPAAAGCAELNKIKLFCIINGASENAHPRLSLFDKLDERKILREIIKLKYAS